MDLYCTGSQVPGVYQVSAVQIDWYHIVVRLVHQAQYFKPNASLTT